MNDIFSNYRDYNYINALIFNNLYRIPIDIDAVIGIPRSGMLTATIIAEFRSLPMTDIFSFVSGVETTFINSEGSLSKQFRKDNIRHILLVDDTVGTGKTLENAVNLIKSKFDHMDITTFCVFTEPISKEKVDIYCEAMEYQFMPYSILKRAMPYACVDMDGVLTEEVPYEYDTDDNRYVKFLRNQKPVFIPETKIGTIVTGRLSKYGDITKEWLDRHGIEYGNIIMLDLPSKSRRDEINVGEFKGYVYSKSNSELFIESNLYEARMIKQFSKKPVYCTQICNMI